VARMRNFVFIRFLCVGERLGGADLCYRIASLTLAMGGKCRSGVTAPGRCAYRNLFAAIDQARTRSALWYRRPGARGWPWFLSSMGQSSKAADCGCHP
jgi:hypothetical protein